MRDTYITAAKITPPMGSEMRPAVHSARSVLVAYAIRTAAGGNTGRRYRMTLSPGEIVKNARIVTTQIAQTRRTQGRVLRIRQPCRRPGHSQPVHGSTPSGKKTAYASNPIHPGVAPGAESAG